MSYFKLNGWTHTTVNIYMGFQSHLPISDVNTALRVECSGTSTLLAFIPQRLRQARRSVAQCVCSVTNSFGWWTMTINVRSRELRYAGSSLFPTANPSYS